MGSYLKKTQVYIDQSDNPFSIIIVRPTAEDDQGLCKPLYCNTNDAFAFFFIPRCKSAKVVKLAYIGILWWFLAVVLWLSDRLLCDIWKYLSVPYFHCGWHIFILLGSNIGCVLGCYFYAHSEHRELKSELSFWPAQLGTWGLPYIAVRKKHLQKRT